MNKEFTLLNDNTIEEMNEEGIKINRWQYENNNIKTFYYVKTNRNNRNNRRKNRKR